MSDARIVRMNFESIKQYRKAFVSVLALHMISFQQVMGVSTDEHRTGRCAGWICAWTLLLLLSSLRRHITFSSINDLRYHGTEVDGRMKS